MFDLLPPAKGTLSGSNTVGIRTYFCHDKTAPSTPEPPHYWGFTITFGQTQHTSKQLQTHALDWADTGIGRGHSHCLKIAMLSYNNKEHLNWFLEFLLLQTHLQHCTLGILTTHNIMNAWFQGSVWKQMSTALFWVITQLVKVISYRRLGPEQ